MEHLFPYIKMSAHMCRQAKTLQQEQGITQVKQVEMEMIKIEFDHVIFSNLAYSYVSGRSTFYIKNQCYDSGPARSTPAPVCFVLLLHSLCTSNMRVRKQAVLSAS